MIKSLSLRELASRILSEEEKEDNRKKLQEAIKSYKDLEKSMIDKGLDISILHNMVC